jgi:GAF domain-containing protein
MRSQVLRLTLGTVSWIAIGACAVFLFHSERRVAERRAAFRAFDVRGRETVAALAELRMAQQAYVAAGQSVTAWTTKVDSTSAAARGSLTMLREAAVSAASKSALEDATAMVADFVAIDKRIRGYLISDAQLMASDIIFTEGGETAANAARQVERARLEERDLVQASEATSRKQEAMALAGAVGLAVLVIGVLIRAPAAKAADSKSSVPAVGREDWAIARDDFALPQGAAEIPTQPIVRQPVDTAVARTAAALKNAAQVCTDLGRVNDADELNTLMERAADVLDASGLMLWLGASSGGELHPALAYGYSEETVARMPTLARSANNAAATAYRTGTLQIVLSRPGSAKGAVVAPVLSSNGCIGVLSAEVRDGAEASDTVQALAAIFAAQLASVLPARSASSDQRTQSAAM